ncbi:hypothetical protein, partial [Escherichia coli]|uniref:hypothetical protein n=1 Tax=Escherichia coli TaxID=562 RepID=UPI00345AAE93
LGFSRTADYAVFVGVWGPANPGDGKINGNDTSALMSLYNSNQGCPCPNPRDQVTAQDYKLVTGDKTVVSYTDSHAKVVPTSSLYPNTVTTSSW